MSRYKFDWEQVSGQGTQSFIAGTGAVSRYKLSRSQKFVKVQDFNCVQMRVSGCSCHYKFVLSAGAKAKTVTTCPAKREPVPRSGKLINYTVRVSVSYFTFISSCFPNPVSIIFLSVSSSISDLSFSIREI